MTPKLRIESAFDTVIPAKEREDSFNFLLLLFCANKKEFSLGRIKREMVRAEPQVNFVKSF